jgi:hypothetical protein
MTWVDEGWSILVERAAWIPKRRGILVQSGGVSLGSDWLRRLLDWR